MWSYVADGLGRRRITVFYKAAFYDRHAWMSLNTVYSYVTECVRLGADIITDEVWATPAAVARELRKAAAQAQERLNTFNRQAGTRGPDGELDELICADTAIRDRCAELAARFEAVTGA